MKFASQDANNAGLCRWFANEQSLIMDNYLLNREKLALDLGALLDQTSNLSVVEICQKLGCTRFTMQRAFADLGRPMPESKCVRLRVEVARERLAALLAEGRSNNDIQKSLGLSNRGFFRLCARYGLKPNVSLNQRLAGQGLKCCWECRQIKSLEEDFYSERRRGGAMIKAGRCKACAVRYFSEIKPASRGKSAA